MCVCVSMCECEQREEEVLLSEGVIPVFVGKKYFSCGCGLNKLGSMNEPKHQQQMHRRD